MKIKDLIKIEDALAELYDFFTSNADADESGLFEEISEIYGDSKNIIKDAKYKLYLRNAIAKNIRKSKK